MMPVRYNVGDKVVITEACIERMKSSNRSCVHPQYPSDSFIKKAELCIGIEGEVTHTFPPGYEVTARFGEQAFHMKDNWIAVAGTPANELGEPDVLIQSANRSSSPSF